MNFYGKNDSVIAPPKAEQLNLTLPNAIEVANTSLTLTQAELDFFDDNAQFNCYFSFSTSANKDVYMAWTVNFNFSHFINPGSFQLRSGIVIPNIAWQAWDLEIKYDGSDFVINFGSATKFTATNIVLKIFKLPPVMADEFLS